LEVRAPAIGRGGLAASTTTAPIAFFFYIFEKEGSCVFCKMKEYDIDEKK